MLPQTIFYWFTLSTFILGYLIPLVLIIYFNSRLIRRLYLHTRKFHTSIPLRSISIYTILIAIVYFVCWTPYWTSILYAIYMSVFEVRQTDASDLIIFIYLCVHLLPYIGSASNWILYGLLNTQLQRRQAVDHFVGTLHHDEYTGGIPLSTTVSPFTGDQSNALKRDRLLVPSSCVRNSLSKGTQEHLPSLNTECEIIHNGPEKAKNPNMNQYSQQILDRYYSGIEQEGDQRL